MKEYRLHCGNYRHFIVQADNEQQARERFDWAAKNTDITIGFELKEVTKVEEV